MTFDDFQKRVKELAEAAGLTDYELYYADEASRNVQVLNGEISGYANDRTAGCSFRTIVDGRSGYSATELFTEEEAARIVARAIDNARTLEKEEPATIFAGSPAYQAVVNDVPASADIQDLALTMFRQTLALDPKVQPSSENEVEEASGSIRLINSKGLDLSNQYAVQMLFQSAVVREGEEQYDAYEFDAAPLQGYDTEALAKKAVQKVLDKIGAGPVPSGSYKVVLDHSAFTSLLTAHLSIFSAKAAQKGLSLLAGKEGESIAAPVVTIIDDPFYPESPAKAPFDAEGVATATRCIVENGVFRTLLYNLETAEKAGVPSTGNASRASYADPVSISPYTFYVVPGQDSPEALYAKVGDGLLITDLAGLHAGVNPITGDFSLMASGYRIQDGKKAGFVTGITVSGSFFDLLKSIEAVGSDLEFSFPRGFMRIGSPSVLVPVLSVAGS